MKHDNRTTYLIFVIFRNGIIASTTFRVRVVNEEQAMRNTSNRWVKRDVLVVLEIFVQCIPGQFQLKNVLNVGYQVPDECRNIWAHSPLNIEP